MHAIEELYFFRRYGEAKKVADEALKGQLSDEFRKLLQDYKSRAQAKLQGGRNKNPEA
jgi:hypothetical protein